MPRFKLTIECAGTRYSGWQIQKNARTVQGEIDRAVKAVTGRQDFKLYGSGRTDAGVDKNVSVKIDSSTVRFVAADTAILDMDGVTTGGADGAIKTHVTWVYVKRNGEWMVVAIRATRIQ